MIALLAGLAIGLFWLVALYLLIVAALGLDMHLYIRGIEITMETITLIAAACGLIVLSLPLFSVVRRRLFSH